MAITSTLMADPIPTTSGREIGTTQLMRVALADEVEAVVPAHVPALALVVVAPVAAKRTRMKG